MTTGHRKDDGKPMREASGRPLRLHLFHTGHQHIAVFDALLAELAPEIEADHTVRQDLLDRAMAQGRLTDEIARETESALKDVAADGIPVLCTCSTIGPAVDRLQGAPFTVMRIDEAMARKAVAMSDRITICAAARSTLGPTRALVERVAQAMNRAVSIQMEPIEEAWPFFQAGDTEAYIQKIAAHIEAISPAPPVIVLAQASMAPATALLANLNSTILSSPGLGLQAAIDRVRQS